MILNAKTGAVASINPRTGEDTRLIKPASDMLLTCSRQSYMTTPGEIVSLALANAPKYEVHMICFNQAKNTVTSIYNYGRP